MLAWLSAWSEVQTCIWPSWYHYHSLSLASVKLWLVFTFLVPAHPGSPRKRAVKRVCVCVCVCIPSWRLEGSHHSEIQFDSLSYCGRIHKELNKSFRRSWTLRSFESNFNFHTNKTELENPFSTILLYCDSVSSLTVRTGTKKSDEWDSQILAANVPMPKTNNPQISWKSKQNFKKSSSHSERTLRYDTIQDAILTCARKLTWVSLIYHTEPTTKKCKTH